MAGIECELNRLPEEPSLDPHVELQLLRICQEALNNIRKHAKASRVTLTAFKNNNRLTITIEDDGKGFDPAHDDRESKFQGHGLSVMKERAESAGGCFDLESEPGRGTVLRIDVPLNK